MEDVVGKLVIMFYGDFILKLELVGVIGINGKIIIVILLYNMFCKFGYKIGFIFIVCNYIDEEVILIDYIIFDFIILNKLLGCMVDEGCKYVFMEVSLYFVV